MLLVIDIGNTQTVIGVYRGDELISHWRLSSDMQRTADETWIILKMWCQDRGIDAARFEGAVISSVVPSLKKVFTDMSTVYLQCEPLLIGPELDTGLTIRYEPARAVGADRICNAVAGYQHYGGPAIIVDFGTATTFDVISAAGEYRGGIIALGLMGASADLHRVSAVLPRVALEFPESVIGTSTELSLQSGILWGTVAMIDGLAAMIRNELGGGPVRVIATGGIAPLFEGRSREIEVIDPFLTLKGMYYMWQRNRTR
ncbi:type III pantothenate kinase [bacterium]|nr:type III pantothenate kinase [bacterium]